MKNLSLSIFFFLLFCLAPFKSLAVNLDVVVNEIAWMGTVASYNDEWVELYNNTDSPINLEGWILKAADETPTINLTGVIPAKSFYLLERTNDDTVPGISADKIYTGALGNSGEYLKLYDNLNNLVDEVNCSEKWLAGDNTTKQTMETLRQAQSENREWQTSEGPGGTPKSQNSAKTTAKTELIPAESTPAEEEETIKIPEIAAVEQKAENPPEVRPRETF